MMIITIIGKKDSKTVHLTQQKTNQNLCMVSDVHTYLLERRIAPEKN